MKTSIYSQHYDHTQWLNALAFYKDELAIMQKRNAEVASKNTSKEVLQMVEHFQNQFIVQKNNIDVLSSHIKKDEKVIEANINHNPIAVDHRKTEDHTSERNEMASFEKNFEELRAEFKGFLFKWM
jgi:hypothetical protein